jgi:hypothetical protein
MASTSGKEPEQEADHGLPPAIIAQAEAAMLANSRNRRAGLLRSKSDMRQVSSDFQNNDQAGASGRVPITR